jgi:O-acetyl-ADP-ribose deacetylase (regulator of RNase III)
MSIKYVKGNLFESDCNVIGHGCNCFNSFGAGIALQMMEQHMLAWWADQATMRGDHKKLGTFTLASDEQWSGGVRTIFNLYTQYSFSRSKVSADYDAIRSALTHMKLELDENFPDAKVGLPKIGAGLALGDWSIIEKIIEDVFHDQMIYIYYL